MAKVESLGVHEPVALSYLIREGILPPEPKRDVYRWETYVFDDGHGDVEEELLITSTCVAWSQGTFVRNVYRLELEGEEIAHALLTNFASARAAEPGLAHGPDAGRFGSSKTLAKSRQSPKSSPGEKTPGTKADDGSTRQLARALVVFLRTKAHVYSLSGSTHIVDLPFEIERALPAPRGCILQRRNAPTATLAPSPQVPLAPPNSFFSSQIQPAPSFLQSPTLARSFRGSHPLRPSPLANDHGNLNATFQNAFGTVGGTTDAGTGGLYSFTSPLADFGLLSYSLQHQRPRHLGKQQHGLSVEFEALDASEELIYVSPTDELTNGHDHPLTLIVTSNRDTHTLTVWHGWYVGEKSLRDLLKQRAAHKAAKTRRRSSFLSANVGTGATTPAARSRDHARESTAGGTLRLPGEQAHGATSRKRTRQEEEAAMASQMDPDYQPTASQQPARESRRISSMNADMRTSQTNAPTSFGGAGGRRNTSFGGPDGRRSFGLRRSRGSTPGSVFNRSIGADDDLMDLDSNADSDIEESVESIVRHIRATHEAAGADSVFGSSEEGFRRELVVRKLHSQPFDHEKLTTSSAAKSFRVVTFREPLPLHDGENERLAVYIHDQVEKHLVCIKLAVWQRPLFPEMLNAPRISVPVVMERNNVGACSDIMRLGHGQLQALLLSEAGIIFSTEDTSPCPLPVQAPYRIHSPFELSLARDKSIGRNRILRSPAALHRLLHPGPEGCYDELQSDDLYHRRQMQLQPAEPYIRLLLRVCETVLPTREAASVRRIWCMARASIENDAVSLSTTGSDAEWVALVATVMYYVTPILDAKAIAALSLSRLALGKQDRMSTSMQLRNREHENQISSRSAWAWMDSTGIDSAVASPESRTQLDRRKDQLLLVAASLAHELSQPTEGSTESLTETASSNVFRLMLGLHIFREEQKLCTLATARGGGTALAPVVAQLGGLLGLQTWSYRKGSYYYFEGAHEEEFAFVKSTPPLQPQLRLMDEPVSVFQWFEHALKSCSGERYPSLADIVGLDVPSLSLAFKTKALQLTRRVDALSDILEATNGLSGSPEKLVQLTARYRVATNVLETLPEAVAAPFREAIGRCERQPPTVWPTALLQLVGREDLDLTRAEKASPAKAPNTSNLAPRDIQTVCHALEQQAHAAKTRAADRHAVSQLIFSEDRRLIDAFLLMHYGGTQVGECPKEPEWDDAYHFEQQRRVMHFMTLRMMALPAGAGMIHYDCVTPLLTEKYVTSGFTTNVLMQPMGHNLTIDRQWLTEEKCGWAYFHAGVSVGMRISPGATGIDTSWIAFNKPSDLTNRHAGLLLALGLLGHLRSLAKWLSFKYLTPKHTMTSVGLMLGLSASYIGSMDSLITRMLSVHITRMLPPGAAELNVSPTTQTAGLMGIGLLYYNTQHRRMSEVMLSEIEYMQVEDPDSGPDPLRDESYRLAAGFALGLINLGQGGNLKGLHGMHLPERLLAMAVGPRPVHAVHVFDRATAGAIVAIALVYMKSGDKAIAAKVDIPDTEAQFDHVRPDVLMLRAMARHIIMWNHIKADAANPKNGWIQANLPACYRGKLEAVRGISGKRPLSTADVPFYNIVTGLAWALGLRYAGSGDIAARDEILSVVDAFYTISGDTYFYDAKLARSTVRRCIDILALSAATVMAGTGDITTFRYLRRLHGRTDAETPYGSHLAAHLAIGALFMAGGTRTFGISDLAIAALIIAFYPIFPTEVSDNRVHLQAFRHFWVFATEARCLVIEDIDTRRPISMPLQVTTRDGQTLAMTAPCLLPDLDTIATVHTDDPAYWRITLDFTGNPAHLAAFRANQHVFVRRCPASEAHGGSAFCAALTMSSRAVDQNDLWQLLLRLKVFAAGGVAEAELLTGMDERTTMLDDRLVVQRSVSEHGRDALWNLRVLFAWAERMREEEGGEGRLRWLGREVIEMLRAGIEERQRRVVGK